MVDLLGGVVEAQHLGEVAHDVVLAGRPVGGVTRGPRAGREVGDRKLSWKVTWFIHISLHQGGQESKTGRYPKSVT